MYVLLGSLTNIPALLFDFALSGIYAALPWLIHAKLFCYRSIQERLDMADLAQFAPVASTSQNIRVMVGLDAYGPYLKENLNTAIVVIGVIVNISGIIGNGTIVVVIARSRTLRKPYNVLLASMAVKDLLLCGVVNLVQIASIHMGRFALTRPYEHILCRAHNILWIQLIVVSILHITAIAGHRYLLVYHQHLSNRITNKFTIALLIASLHGVSFAMLSKKISAEMRFIRSIGCCIGWVEGNVNLIMLSITLTISILVLLVSYICIHHKVNRVKRQLQQVNNEGINCVKKHRNLKKTSQHKKILQCMITIMLLLVSGYLPVLMAIGNLRKGKDVSSAALSMTMLILWITNAVHSLVYGVLDPSFKKAYMTITGCKNDITPSESTIATAVTIRDLHRIRWHLSRDTKDDDWCCIKW